MKQNIEYPIIVAAATTAAALLIVGGVMFWRQKKRLKTKECSLEEMKIPTKWVKVGEVGELILYPLKGAKRKCLQEAQVTKIGLRELQQLGKLALQDRVFIVHNDKKEIMNVKKNSKMLFLNTTAEDETSVKFSFPDAKDLFVRLPEDGSKLNKVNFYYGEVVSTVDCGDEAAEWFSQRLLGKPTGLRLGCYIQSLVPPRTTDGAFTDQLRVYPKFHSEYMGAFADIASYMVMAEESLKDLNSRLDKPVNEHHFRPNLLVKGSPAYAEDNWDWLKIGDNVILRGFKYCTRCVVTSINPDTAEKDPATEPLRTLRKYRQVKEPEIKEVEGSSPVMGMYVGCHQMGLVRVGDPVYVNDTTP